MYACLYVWARLLEIEMIQPYFDPILTRFKGSQLRPNINALKFQQTKQKKKKKKGKYKKSNNIFLRNVSENSLLILNVIILEIKY